MCFRLEDGRLPSLLSPGDDFIALAVRLPVGIVLASLDDSRPALARVGDVEGWMGWSVIDERDDVDDQAISFLSDATTLLDEINASGLAALISSTISRAPSRMARCAKTY